MKQIVRVLCIGLACAGVITPDYAQAARQDRNESFFEAFFKPVAISLGIRAGAEAGHTLFSPEYRKTTLIVLGGAVVTYIAYNAHQNAQDKKREKQKKKYWFFRKR